MPRQTLEVGADLWLTSSNHPTYRHVRWMLNDGGDGSFEFSFIPVVQNIGHMNPHIFYKSASVTACSVT